MKSIDQASKRRDPGEIPLCDVRADNEPLLGEVLAAIERVVRSGQYILGSEVEALESEVARYLGAKHAVAVASGTDALLLALEAVGVRGKEVITTAWSFAATAEAIVRAGADPVFVDIDPGTLNLDPEQVETALTARTAAIVPVHLFGRPCPMRELETIATERGIPLVEDAAQSFGAMVGSHRVGALPGSHAAAFSFYPTKNLGGFGDGGMLTTNDERVASAGRSLRQHGFSSGGASVTRVGYNSRLDALQAAALRVKLRHLEPLNAGRRRAADRYRKLLAELDVIELLDDADEADNVFHQFPIRVPGRRDEVLEQLKSRGIQARAYYPTILPDMPAWNTIGQWPHARAASRDILCLPIWATMSPETVEQVASALKDVLIE